MSGKSRFLVGVVALTLLTWLAVPAAAVAEFERAPILDVDCRPEFVSGDAARAGGATRGFVAFDGGNCGEGHVIWWFSGRGDDWRARRTPYHGHIMATASDGAAMALLFANEDGTWLGWRKADGGFDRTPRKLSSRGLTGAGFPFGDLLASGGRFWAVWTEQVGPGGEFAQTELFQSQNIGQGHYFDGVMPRTRITNNNTGDDFPTLAAEPTGTGAQTYALVWTRNDGARGESSVLRVARATGAGDWTKTTFATRGYNSEPNLFSTDSELWLAWTRDNKPAVTSLRDGAWRNGKVFAAQRGFSPDIGVSSGHVFLGWTTLSGRNVKVAERAGGEWNIRNITAGTDGTWRLLGLTVAGDDATAVVTRPTRGKVIAFSQS